MICRDRAGWSNVVTYRFGLIDKSVPVSMEFIPDLPIHLAAV